MSAKVGKRETRFIASLFEVPRELGHASMDQFLERIVQRCAEWFGATTVSLFVRSDDPECMSLAATGGDSKSIPKEATIVIGEGIAGVAAQDGAPVLFNEIGGKRQKLVSSMIVPLGSSSGVIGVLNLSRQVGLERFNEADLRLARSVAGHLGLAVENARLVANLSLAIQDLEAERAKFSGIFNGLGLPAFLVDQSGSILESNPAARKLPELPLSQFWTARPLREQEYVDQTTGRSWIVVSKALPNRLATLVLEETTERERQRREIDRLNRLAEIGQMTATIAHEIRNPLTGIRSAAQMIAQAPENAVEFSGIIEQEVMRLNELCNDFLSFAKPLQLNVRPTTWEAAVLDVAKRMRPEFDAKPVELSVEIAENLPTIEMDPIRMEQVLHNLMLNALQASRPGSAVRVCADAAGISVIDSGVGIPETELDRLFTPFFTTKAQGTGLGLSMARKIVEAHGAEIAVSSKAGQGTTFSVRFPLRRAA